ARGPVAAVGHSGRGAIRRARAGARARLRVEPGHPVALPRDGVCREAPRRVSDGGPRGRGGALGPRRHRGAPVTRAAAIRRRGPGFGRAPVLRARAPRRRVPALSPGLCAPLRALAGGDQVAVASLGRCRRWRERAAVTLHLRVPTGLVSSDPVAVTSGVPDVANRGPVAATPGGVARARARAVVTRRVRLRHGLHGPLAAVLLGGGLVGIWRAGRAAVDGVVDDLW